MLALNGLKTDLFGYLSYGNIVLPLTYRPHNPSSHLHVITGKILIEP